MDPAAVVTILAAVAYVAIELFYVATGQPTITARTRLLNARWPTLGAGVCLLVGLLLGHLFLQ